MILIVATLAAISGALATVFWQLRKAPIGYEDQHGFHVVRQIKGSAIVRNRKAEHAFAASLKRAQAN